MEHNKIRVAITHGDTNGVGYELIFKTFAEPEMLELCTPIIYGSPKIAAYHRKALDIQGNFTIISDAKEAHEGKVNLLTCFDEEVKVELGTPTAESGMAALRAMDRAMTDFRDGAFDVLVASPLCNDNIHDDNFTFPGLTRYVETSLGDGSKAVNIMLGRDMSVAVEAAGADIRDVAGRLTEDGLCQTVKALALSARRDFRLSNPRVAVLSLNADRHGNEEQTVITPAIKRLSEEGVNAFGPYTSEEMFGTRNYEAFDMILAMYDDQGTIPFRTLAPEDGVCLIANLPVVCTTPMVGPQYEIAGQGVADESAFRQAIYYAIDIFRNRANYDEPLANPLPKLYHEKRDESEKVRFAIPKKHDGQYKGRDDRRPFNRDAARDNREHTQENKDLQKE